MDFSFKTKLPACVILFPLHQVANRTKEMLENITSDQEEKQSSSTEVCFCWVLSSKLVCEVNSNAIFVVFQAKA